MNLARVLAGFRKENVGLRHFAPTTGYGYDDAGRDTLDRLFAHALFAEDALVRPQLTSGTHALYLALSGLCQWEMLLLPHQESRMIRLKTR